MNRHQRTPQLPAHRITRLRAVAAAVAAVVTIVVAGCTSTPEPAAGALASAGPSVRGTSSGASAATGTTTASRSSATSESTPSSTVTSTAGSTTSAHTDVTAPRSTTAPRRTATSDAPAATTSKKTPDAPASSTPKASSRPAPTSSTLRPPPKTPVAPPSRGNIHDVVPSATPVTLQAAPLTAPARPDAGVSVQVTDVRAVSTEARFPGEISGPGIAVTVHVVNSSSDAIDLDNAIVDVRGADGTRAVEVSGTPASPMSGSLPPGQEASGVYVFTIPRDQRNPISIRFSYAAETPTVLFVGDAQ